MSARPSDPSAEKDHLVMLRHILSSMSSQGEGRYLALYEPGKREVAFYHYVEGLDARPESLDVHAYIDASAAAEASARSSWVRWKWPSTGNEHIPNTFIPRRKD